MNSGRKLIASSVAAALILVAGSLAAAAGYGWVLPDRLSAPSPARVGSAPQEQSRVGSASKKTVPTGFVEVRYPRAGFALGYPATWTRLPSEDPQVVLLAMRGPQVSVLVRVVDLDVSVGPAKVAEMKALTDKIVTSGESVELLLQPERIRLAGLPGYFYLYSFRDAKTGQTGTHSHLFVFKDHKMITIVFQAVPLERFPRAAPAFDRITSTFRVLEQR